ncbi:MAG: hypothetical protein ACKVWV_17605 [Planctomycetota bacterium]
MIASRLAAGIGFLFLLALPARAQIVFAEDFESGFSNWSLTGLWHAESNASSCGAANWPFPSGTACAWYGLSHAGQCDFETNPSPNTGVLTTVAPIVVAPAPGQVVTVRYRNIIETEGCLPDPVRDQALVQVSQDGGASWITVISECRGNQPFYDAWHKGRAFITTFATTPLLLRFSFDTISAALNGGEGWWIDDVQVRLEPGLPGCDAGDSCPCGNFNSFSQNPEIFTNVNIGGCYHSNNAQAELSALGRPSIAADDVTLTADTFTGRAVVFYAGAPGEPGGGSPFGSGLGCSIGQRIAIKAATSGQAQYPEAGDPPLSSFGAVAGQRRGYQVVYRGQFPGCGRLNTTNAYTIDWRP